MEKRLLPKGLPESFCFKPWNEIYSHFDTVGPCCVNYKLHNGDFESYLSSKELVELRQAFLKGHRHPSCKVCWETEATDSKSVRQNDLNFSKKLDRVSISLSNKCNFKCLMCNPEDSSSWSLDKTACSIRGMAPYFSQKNFSTIDWIIDKAKDSKIILTVMGGEPLICDEYVYLINQIDKYNLYENISLVLTTNLSVLNYHGLDHIEVFSRFPELIIYTSFDGVGSVGEYIRYGFSSKRFEKNLIKISKYVKFFSTTIMLYNIFDLPNIFEYADKFNISVNFNFLVDPKYLSIGVLSHEEREHVLEYYEQKNFKNDEIINFITNTVFVDQKADFISYTTGLDSLWNRSITDSIPELKFLL